MGQCYKQFTSVIYSCGKLGSGQCYRQFTRVIYSCRKLETVRAMANVIKLFHGHKLRIFAKATLFAPGKPFHPSLISVGQAGAYPIEEPFRCSTLG